MKCQLKRHLYEQEIMDSRFLSGSGCTKQLGTPRAGIRLAYSHHEGPLTRQDKEGHSLRQLAARIFGYVAHSLSGGFGCVLVVRK